MKVVNSFLILCIFFSISMSKEECVRFTHEPGLIADSLLKKHKVNILKIIDEYPYLVNKTLLDEIEDIDGIVYFRFSSWRRLRNYVCNVGEYGTTLLDGGIRFYIAEDGNVKIKR
jgi:hypothetical protein